MDNAGNHSSENSRCGLNPGLSREGIGVPRPFFTSVNPVVQLLEGQRHSPIEQSTVISGQPRCRALAAQIKRIQPVDDRYISNTPIVGRPVGCQSTPKPSLFIFNSLGEKLAERVGFEPTKGYKPLLVFKTSAFNRSATSPDFMPSVQKDQCIDSLRPRSSPHGRCRVAPTSKIAPGDFVNRSAPFPEALDSATAHFARSKPQIQPDNVLSVEFKPFFGSNH